MTDILTWRLTRDVPKLMVKVLAPTWFCARFGTIDRIIVAKLQTHSQG